MVAVPLSKIRRQGLTPVDRRFAETLRRVADLASSEGVRPATVLVGKRVPSPFCPVRPGAYRIAISRKLMVTPGSPTFTALIRHELAHLAHRDVTLSRLGRTLGWVLFPAAGTTDDHRRGAVQGEIALALDLAWRSTALALVVALVQRDLGLLPGDATLITAARRLLLSVQLRRLQLEQMFDNMEW